MLRVGPLKHRDDIMPLFPLQLQLLLKFRLFLKLYRCDWHRFSSCFLMRRGGVCHMYEGSSSGKAIMGRKRTI